MKKDIQGVTKDGLFLFAIAVASMAGIVLLGFIIWAAWLLLNFILIAIGI